MVLLLKKVDVIYLHDQQYLSIAAGIGFQNMLLKVRETVIVKVFL